VSIGFLVCRFMPNHLQSDCSTLRPILPAAGPVRISTTELAKWIAARRRVG
jgi:hypothetical protein